MGGEAVPQGVRPDALVDVRGLSGLDDDAVELARADRSRSALSGEEPAIGNEDALLPSGAPPVAAQQKQAFGQHRVAVASAFTALDPEQHQLAVAVVDLERFHLAHPHARAISDRHRRLTLETALGSDRRYYLVPGKDNR